MINIYLKSLEPRDLLFQAVCSSWIFLWRSPMILREWPRRGRGMTFPRNGRGVGGNSCSLGVHRQPLHSAPPAFLKHGQKIFIIPEEVGSHLFILPSSLFIHFSYTLLPAPQPSHSGHQWRAISKCVRKADTELQHQRSLWKYLGNW